MSKFGSKFFRTSPQKNPTHQISTTHNFPHDVTEVVLEEKENIFDEVGGG
jgi:hypothetical protein